MHIVQSYRIQLIHISVKEWYFTIGTTLFPQPGRRERLGHFGTTMRARLVIFPIRGRNWCFNRSIVPNVSDSETSSLSPSTFREFWKNVSVTEKPLTTNAELFMDYVANKMNKAWSGIEKAPQGSFKNKIHGFGVWVLSRVKPSEMFLKSISKEVTSVGSNIPIKFGCPTSSP